MLRTASVRKMCIRDRCLCRGGEVAAVVGCLAVAGQVDEVHPRARRQGGQQRLPDGAAEPPAVDQREVRALADDSSHAKMCIRDSS